jgi:lipoprotein-releasing system ATP-binding protein
MNNIVLRCEGLAKTYSDGASRIEVLREINFSLAPAEMIAIIGNSGSGKSTLLQILAGLDKPTSGEVYINDKNIHALKEDDKCTLRNQYLGFVYQFHHLLAEFSALENTAMPLLIRGTATHIIREKAMHLLEKVGLAHRLHHRVGELSGGERQRVAIARALIGDPLCILADEPTGNLDPMNAERVLQLFFDLQKDFKTSVVMVTHDQTIARRAQHTMRIEDGKLIRL